MESPRHPVAGGHPVAGVDYPRTFQEFDTWFGSETACREYIRRLRWPDGFVCPHCAAVGEPWGMSRRLLRCRACDRQVSLTAGTVLQGHAQAVAAVVSRHVVRHQPEERRQCAGPPAGARSGQLRDGLDLAGINCAGRWSALAAIASPVRSRSTRLTSAARKRAGADVRPRTRPLSSWRQRKAVVALAASVCTASPTYRRTA